MVAWPCAMPIISQNALAVCCVLMASMAARPEDNRFYGADVRYSSRLGMVCRPDCAAQVAQSPRPGCCRSREKHVLSLSHPVLPGSWPACGGGRYGCGTERYWTASD